MVRARKRISNIYHLQTTNIYYIYKLQILHKNLARYRSENNFIRHQNNYIGSVEVFVFAIVFAKSYKNI